VRGACASSSGWLADQAEPSRWREMLRCLERTDICVDTSEMIIRRMLVPVIAVVAAIATVSLVVVLQRRAQAAEGARASVAQLQVHVATTQSTEVRQAITGTAPLQITRTANAGYAGISHALAALARTDPVAGLAAALDEVRQSQRVDARAGEMSQRYRASPDERVLPRIVVTSYVATADAHDGLRRALAHVSRGYEREASATVTRADWGSAVGVAVLLTMFLMFYVRSQQARVLAASQASSDYLTGLGNRRRLFRDLAASQLEGSPSTLVLIDLDGFKRYNDSLGHVAGDDLLRLIGVTLKDALGPEGSAYRLGGDEFLLRLSGRVDSGAVAEIIDAVRGEVRRSVGLSYGIAVIGPGEVLDDAMRRADEMMYRDKTRGTFGVNAGGVR
jgi:diguanylate cyclase (GGDEF)-like protein